MMGCGKTTVGGLLAQLLPDYSLVDTDALIELRADCSIRDIFRDYGEGRFRDWESLVAHELSKRQGLIVACGGGLPLQDEAIAALKENGLVFWLDRDPGDTYDSLDRSGRPLAQAGREDFLWRYQYRAPIYKRWADCRIPCREGPERLARLIIQRYKEMTKA